MPAIGIDLGTTNSLVAYWTEDGPRIIPNIHGSNLTPSVVGVDDNNEILIGAVAKERLITHPHMTASVFKRYMGTNKEYKLGKYSFTPVELSSFILRALKEDAEAFFGEEVKEAVISIPAYFNDTQRKATKQAAELAGLKVERLISEPTAAAIAYGLHQEEEETQFIVFDLGGGTFDVSILELFEGVMEVRSISGDNFLGGEDFTNLLVSYFIDSEKLEVEALSSMEKSALYKQAEICKRAIGENNSGTMTFTFGDKTYEKVINKDEFDKLATQLLFRFRNPIERALRDAELSPSEMDAVILIGGATRMPIIKSVVSKMFGKLPYTNINPDEAVALGAAIQVALMERNEALKEMVLTDVCPYTLGVETSTRHSDGTIESGYFLPIIERNTTIPVSRVKSLVTIVDNQSIMQISVYQGEGRKINENLWLGEFEINLPKGPAGKEAVDLRYTYDINGLLEVEAKVLSSGEVKSVVIEKNKGTMTKKEIEERLKALKDIKIHPRDKMENKLLLAKGERLYQESLRDKRQYIASLLKDFDGVLASQDDKAIKKAAKELEGKLNQLEGWLDY